MRILLVEPPFYSFIHYDRWFFSLGLAQLAAAVRADGHEVMLYDGDKYFDKDISTMERAVFIKNNPLYYENVDNLDYHIWQHFKQTLDKFNPEVVGVSVYTCKLRSALNVLKIVRDYNKEIKICVGAAHVTGAPEMFIGSSLVDGVFLGYADISFPQWLSQGCPYGVFKGNLEDIDFNTLPEIDRGTFLYPEFYTPEDMSMVATSRGCVGQCTFCSGFMCAHKVKFRTQESVRSELTELRDKWKIKNVTTIDASFTDFPEHAKRITDLYKELNLTWGAEGRWATITRELLEYFVNHGCNYFHVGLESGSDRILRYIKKGCTKKMIREKSKILDSLGIKWKLCCIIGFPEETLEEMKETMELALEIKPSNISLNSFCPLPGTEAYKSIPNLTPEMVSTVNQVYPNRCFSKYMDLETYQKIFLEITEVFDGYNRKKKGWLR